MSAMKADRRKKKTRIVIVGAGFVGLPVARMLARRAPESFDVALVNAGRSFIFMPRLIDALEQDAEPPHATADLETLAKRDGFRFIRGNALDVDRTSRTIGVQTAAGLEPMPYDYLVLCQGSRANFFGIPGAEQYTVPLKSFEDVKKIHERAEECIQNARKATNGTKRKLLSVVVVGGGPAGVESVCSLKLWYEKAIQRIDPSLLPFASFTLIQAAPQLLPGFPHAMVAGSLDALHRQGINVLLGEMVQGVEQDLVRTASGQTIPSCLILWAAGIRPNVLPITPNVSSDPQGCLSVNSRLQVDDRIFAAGDIVTFHHRQVILPKNAQTSLLMADVIADNILRLSHGRRANPFQYSSKGSAILLGDTGFINLKMFVLHSRITRLFRDLFYRYRYRQVVGKPL